MQTAELSTLFPSELAYVREVYTQILEDGATADPPEWHDHLDGITLHALPDLQRRFAYLPPEHEAPMIRVPSGLRPHECGLLFQGILSNQRSQPIIVEWFAVVFGKRNASRIVPLQELIEEGALSSTPPPRADGTALMADPRPTRLRVRRRGITGCVREVDLGNATRAHRTALRSRRNALYLVDG